MHVTTTTTHSTLVGFVGCTLLLLHVILITTIGCCEAWGIHNNNGIMMRKYIHHPVIMNNQQRSSCNKYNNNYHHHHGIGRTTTATTTSSRQQLQQQQQQSQSQWNQKSCCTSLHSTISPLSEMMGALTTSLIAGSIAGAIGVGVAYPLDTLKLKQQVFQRNSSSSSSSSSSTSTTSTSSSTSSRIAATTTIGAKTKSNDRSMIQVIQDIYQTEGIRGFYGGVKGMMIGQSIFEAVAYTTNFMVLRLLRRSMFLSHSWKSLVIAAACAGFVSSFVVVPFERIKIMMQSQLSRPIMEHNNSHDNQQQQQQQHSQPYYQNEMECLRAIVRQEGFRGLMFRGLGPTLIREIPSSSIYFVVAAIFMQSKIVDGQLASILGGALAGCISWFPVYPVDVIKTKVQNTSFGQEADDDDDDEDCILLTTTTTTDKNGTKHRDDCRQKKKKKKNNNNMWTVTKELYQQDGINAFFDGLTTKTLRSTLNHAVTFSVYDNLLAVF